MSGNKKNIIKIEKGFLKYHEPKHGFKSEKDYIGEIDDNIFKEHAIVYDDSKNLSADFLFALKNNSFTDASIKCGNYTRQIHKFVLSARSPVFDAMFSTPMVESEKCEINISDIHVSVLDDLLSFIYGAQVKNLTVSKSCDLLYVAEKYQVKGLKYICTSYLRYCLSTQTALQILPFAHLYDQELRMDTVELICKNFADLRTTVEWEDLQFKNPQLAIQVYSRFVDKIEYGILHSSKYCVRNFSAHEDQWEKLTKCFCSSHKSSRYLSGRTMSGENEKQ